MKQDESKQGGRNEKGKANDAKKLFRSEPKNVKQN
jgi:hypothetical protein